MKIDPEKCSACLECVDVCPMNCMVGGDDVVSIDQDECVECGVCLRSGVCPVEAIYMPEESRKYPRSIRAAFSDPGVQYPELNQGGRGTEEMKTNDVTGRYRRGEYGMALEFGRPGTGTRIAEIEKVTTVLRSMNVDIEEANPVYLLLADKNTGKMKPEVLQEKVLSAIVEFKIREDQLEEVVKKLIPVLDQVDTVVGCGDCVFTCTVAAISLKDERADIDRERCVECGNCLRVAGCPTGALQQDELSWPRIIRKYFSDNQFQWPEEMRYTTGYGRGTEECKTNDRKGKFKRGEVGVLVELGRPGISTSLLNAERIIQALMEVGAEMAEKSPLTALLADGEKGILPEEITKERVLSCIVEGKVKLANLEKTLNLLRKVSSEIDTVFSLGLVTRMEDGFVSPIEPVINKMGLPIRPNAKINLGLGKPLCEE